MARKIKFPKWLEYNRKENKPTREELANAVGKSVQWVDAAKRGDATAKLTKEHIEIWERLFR